ncbi:MAG: isoprenylcysteine carboxylmethyltransferase family protein, partial [Robiginitomaculum sp.]|nr:isoprenylcysteine carboxylmethyltransferase family protein [Robiginitomaculum sp.]
NDTHPDTHPDTPAVHIPPPVIVAVFLALGLGLEYYLKNTFGPAAGWLFYVGFGLCVLGFGITLWCAVLYRKAKTSILPHTKDSNMIETGPFARSRNPIYLSMLIVFVGVCFIADAPAAMLFAIPTYLALRYYVIAREEAYLTRRFGDEYISYQSRVRRWI